MKNKIVGIFIFIILTASTVCSMSGTMSSNNKINRQDIFGNRTPEILWWYDLDAPSFGSAAVDDIDRDGSLEIVFGTYFNDEHIYALNAESGSLLWKYNTGGCNDASPAIADVDLDGELEVIVPASSPYKVYCFNGSTGQVKWSKSTGYPNCIDSPPAVADVDNDDKPEIILGTFYGYVFCFNGEDGSICWQKNFGTNSYIQSEPNVLDLDGNGQLDVVVAQYSGDCWIYALRGDDGSTLWFSDQPQDSMYHGGSFADIDEDGKPEIAIGCYDSHVYVVNGEDGSPLWNYSASYYTAAPTSIADLNNDGHLEIVFTSYNKLGILSNTGGLLWSYSTGGSIFRGASIADVDGDDVLDIAFGASDGILRVLKGDDGQVIWTYKLQAHYGKTYEIDHAPVIADFNNDGKLDIFIVGGYGTSSPSTNNHGRAYVLSAGEGTGPGWPMFRHDLSHSACFINNKPPSAPLVSGYDEGIVGEEYNYTFISTDPEEDDVYYYIDWNDNSFEEWIGPFSSGKVITIGHIWTINGTYAVKAKARDINNAEGEWSDLFLVTIIKNQPPGIPKIIGPNSGKPNTVYDFDFNAVDPDGDEVKYIIDWGDGNTDTTNLNPSGTDVTVSHSWNSKGTYVIKVKSKDIHDAESDWSPPEIILITKNKNRAINTTFLQFLKNFLENHQNLFLIH